MKKLLLLLVVLCGVQLFAQTYPKNWHLNFTTKDTSLGIDLVNAIKNNPAPATAKTVIVAVIDNGTDVIHPDLVNNIWVNEKEIPGNAVDDDHNGYVDDINGWDFLGNIGEDIEYDNLEMTRLLRDYKKRFDGKSSRDIAKSEQADFKKYKKLEAEFNKELAESRRIFENLSWLKKTTDALIEELDSTNISLKKLEEFSPEKPEAKLAQSIVVSECKRLQMTPKEYFDEVMDGYKHYYASVNFQLSLEFDPREKIGDDYLDPNDNKFGNNELKGPSGEHGTHVAGIIGAIRDNRLPAQGIAPLVKLMIIRAVPDGDERDKDVALAIRYAVDNGAKVINMSFGKAYVFNKKAVDEAIKYAESKDVLMIHGAGNDGQNNDKANNYPTPKYDDGTVCKSWIEVGASDRDQNPADFSNYGKKTVNVFAPGVKVYSTWPDAKYKAIDGTSMASPVVAGLAALIRAYYPHLTAAQVKQVIESSVEKPTKRVKKPGKKKKKTKYKKLCTSAGIVNADKALKAAAAIK